MGGLTRDNNEDSGGFDASRTPPYSMRLQCQAFGPEACLCVWYRCTDRCYRICGGYRVQERRKSHFGTVQRVVVDAEGACDQVKACRLGYAAALIASGWQPTRPATERDSTVVYRLGAYPALL